MMITKPILYNSLSEKDFISELHELFKKYNVKLLLIKSTVPVSPYTIMIDSKTPDINGILPIHIRKLDLLSEVIERGIDE
jgi:hypothetical protein